MYQQKLSRVKKFLKIPFRNTVNFSPSQKRWISINFEKFKPKPKPKVKAKPKLKPKPTSKSSLIASAKKQFEFDQAQWLFDEDAREQAELKIKEKPIFTRFYPTKDSIFFEFKKFDYTEVKTFLSSLIKMKIYPYVRFSYRRFDIETGNVEIRSTMYTNDLKFLSVKKVMDNLMKEIYTETKKYNTIYLVNGVFKVVLNNLGENLDIFKNLYFNQKG